ncbi:hypothetical protein [Priestia megaterium]|uniref:hypothetical protein n=1 Tax=Priestia megaterium TaxID=1404 RepID=UPI003009364A
MSYSSYVHYYSNSVMMLLASLVSFPLFIIIVLLPYVFVYDWCSAVHAAGVRVYPLALSALRCVVIRGSSLALTVWPMLAVLPYAYDSAEYVTITLT